VDAGTEEDPVLELSLRHAREHRDDMALWLALQILMTDDMALADDALQDRLILLQDRLEDKIRTWHGLSDRNAGALTREPAMDIVPLQKRRKSEMMVLCQEKQWRIRGVSGINDHEIEVIFEY
jgi:hypothetical protein